MPEQSIWPGLLLAAGIAILAFGARQIPGATAVSPMILAIIIGMAFHNIVGTPDSAKAGVIFSLRRILCLAIVLLGLQLTATQVVEVGPWGLATIAGALLATFGFTSWLGWVMGVDRKLTQLIAAGTSICGASAVIAMNPVTRGDDEDVAYAVACVTVFGSIATLSYPLLAGLVGLSPHDFGLWAGASIHEIAQVVAAAFQNGQVSSESAIVAKLSRVIMLAPMVLAVAYVAAWHEEQKSSKAAPVPWFLVGFLVLVGLNSIVTIPPGVGKLIGLATTCLLAVSLAAMGLETKVAKLAAMGWKPMALSAASSLFIAIISLAEIKLAA